MNWKAKEKLAAYEIFEEWQGNYDKWGPQAGFPNIQERSWETWHILDHQRPVPQQLQAVCHRDSGLAGCSNWGPCTVLLVSRLWDTKPLHRLLLSWNTSNAGGSFKKRQPRQIQTSHGTFLLRRQSPTTIKSGARVVPRSHEAEEDLNDSAPEASLQRKGENQSQNYSMLTL